MGRRLTGIWLWNAERPSGRIPAEAGVHQGLLRHSAAVRRPQRKESRMDGMIEKGGTEPADLAERPQEAGGDKSAGGPPAQRFAAKRKLRAVSRLLRGEPLELVARELNVTAVGMAGSGCVGRGGGAQGAQQRRPRRRDCAAEE